MARIEFPEETRRRIEEIGSIDLLIGVAGAVNPEEVRAKALQALAGAGGALKVAVAYPGGVQSGAETVGGPSFLTYPLEPRDPSVVPWVEMSGAQRSVFAMAESFGARACAVVHGDLGALDSASLNALIEPVLEGKCDLVMPVYPEGKYDGLINKGILAPLCRVLNGKRVLSALPFDFCASARVLPKLAGDGTARGYGSSQLLWPANTVAVESGSVGQAYLDVRHTTQTEGLELTIVLAQLAGALFAEMEACAAYWQRVRGSQATAMFGTAAAPAEDGSPVDARPMIDSFVLGSRNLEELWRLVLPPVTLLELKRLTRLEPERFRMPDELWARIVYDFALAHRLRNLTRTHLLGALTPLYLGWVASYAQEVGGMTVSDAAERVERLARVYEENKPYLLARWRWPDRSNP